MKCILLEDLSVIIYEQNGQWEIEQVEVELVEMNCIKIGNKYYRRGRSLDISTIEITEITNRPFDDFDTQISCEEYYGG